MKKFITLEKSVGETPLACMESWRETAGIDSVTPLTYAGRLDPMASGKLLVLIGDECKKKDEYLNLDKAYEFSVLIGIGSDTHDVLGRLQTATHIPTVTKQRLTTITVDLVGEIELPYPHFSSKTVQGKPLHTWTLEDRLDEIDIPTKQSTIYSLTLQRIEIKSRADVASETLDKINTIPEVTDERKVIGNDFRRADVRKDWEDIKNNDSLPDTYQIAHFHCIASSGTYMRTLAKVIGEKSGTQGLAWSIHRPDIGKYRPASQVWIQSF